MATYEQELMKEVLSQRHEQEEKERLAQLDKKAKEEAQTPWNQFSEQDQAALLNPDVYVPTMDEKDAMMRRDIDKKAKEGDKDAQAWKEADSIMDSAQKSQDNIQKEINRRQDPSYRNEAEEKQDEARKKYYEHQENRPHIFARDEWRKELGQLEKQVTEAEQHFQQRLEKSSPEELGKLNERMEARVAQYQEAHATRQGIQMLPSEREKAVDQLLQDSKQAYMPNDYKKDIIQHKQSDDEFKQKRAQVLA